MTEEEYISITEYQMVADICMLLSKIINRKHISDERYEMLSDELHKWRKKAHESVKMEDEEL